MLLKRAFSGKKKCRQPDASVPVFLNVYDLTPINGYAYWLGLGVYHSGLQVHGVEYAYGAHDRPALTGIFESEPRRCPGFAFRRSVLVGRTDLGPREVRALMEDLADSYTGDTYSLITKNCNHFCDDASLRLTGCPIPRWVNRLAKIGLICNCVLPVHVSAVRSRGEDALPGSDVEKRKLRGGSGRFATTANSRNSSSRIRRSSSVKT
ncbi:uncharacterized protein M6B38_264720 [Iris pallida]|uniref:PPPDE domain-containing protein n=1 Tax=Iris pallida TaxID=29817 RepID=A0AAX6ID91_IRIPA|nr:uncharacterized protein M6B38_264720 [Iris pallida]